MPKKFEEMTLEERKEAFNKWQKAKSNSGQEPVEFLVNAVEEALTDYLAGSVLEEAMGEVKDALVGALQDIEETVAQRE